MCGAYKHIHTMEEKRMQKTNKKYRTKKLLLLVFPFSFLSVLVLVLLLLLLFSHLLPISLSLSLSLTYLSASHKAATKASDIATNHGAVLLGRRPPAQPARAQKTFLVMAGQILFTLASPVSHLGRKRCFCCSKKRGWYQPITGGNGRRHGATRPPSANHRR